MKQVIRNWLGIKEVELPKPLSKVELRHMVGEAFEEALNGRPDNMYSFFTSTPRPNLFQGILQKEARIQVKQITEDEVESQIKSEEFIDLIIDRIKRKQL
jgi:hypothetical protein